MSKREEALEIISQVGFPSAQKNERSALVLLVLLGLRENDPWEDAKQPLLRIVDIMDEMKEHYGKEYAPNSRETIRRHTIHQFEDARIINRNADDPSRPTNSGLTNYSVTDEFLNLVRLYGTKSWDNGLKGFKADFSTLKNIYLEERDILKIPVKTPGNIIYELSPGGHNELQKAIVEEFGAYFAPGSKLLYLGDTSNKYLHIDSHTLKKISLPEIAHDKLPDVVLYDEDKNWIYFIEAVTSHGPINPKRRLDLLSLLKDSEADPIFVTAFLNGSDYKRYATEIAWETEVWIADNPKHMIHLNGHKFLGPWN